MYRAMPGRAVSLKPWELRAAVYARLAPISGWFTEGFDTADLQAARGLLEELASASAPGTLPSPKTSA